MYYRGILGTEEPLHDFLNNYILRAVLQRSSKSTCFDVFQLDASGSVVRYHDKSTSTNIVAKFFGPKWLHGRQNGDEELRSIIMYQEFENIRQARALGLVGRPHRVVEPYAVCEQFSFALFEEFCFGETLDCFIRAAVDYGHYDQLSCLLNNVAGFLADLHRQSFRQIPYDTTESIRYLRDLAHQLASWDIISTDEASYFSELGIAWIEGQSLKADNTVLLHGDATPTNLIFDSDYNLTAIDLERSRFGDCAIDVGRFVAEIKHSMFWYTGNPWSSEPLIDQFYSAYIDKCAMIMEDINKITLRGRYYMGCDLLRISRNHWLDLGYRHNLIRIAKECLAL